MTVEFRSRYHKKLYEFAMKCELDDHELEILDVFIEQADPVTLEDLAAQVFHGMPHDERTAYKADFGKKYKEVLIRNGIAELQDLAVPILLSEDGKYRLGDSIDDVGKVIGLLVEEIAQLQSRLEALYRNLGWQLEIYRDEEYPAC